jgi:hypothetical protein
MVHLLERTQVYIGRAIYIPFLENIKFAHKRSVVMGVKAAASESMQILMMQIVC